jgi:hypothetical protein
VAKNVNKQERRKGKNKKNRGGIQKTRKTQLVLKGKSQRRNDGYREEKELKLEIEGTHFRPRMETM